MSLTAPTAQQTALPALPATAYPQPTGGRPLMLTPSVIAAIEATVRAGGFADTSAKALGIHRHTINRWLARGRIAWHNEIDGIPCPDSERPFFDLCVRVEIARAQAISESFAAVRKAGEKDWKAHQYYLACMDGARFGQQHTLRIEAGFVPQDLVERCLSRMRDAFEGAMEHVESLADPAQRAVAEQVLRMCLEGVTEPLLELQEHMPQREQAEAQ